jgi:hypothetical protein
VSRSALIAALLLPAGCRMLGPDELSAWKAEHGIPDTSGDAHDTGLPLDPPDELCTEPWGRVVSSMEREEDVRSVQAGSSYALMYWFEGPADLCDLGCTVDWVDEPYLTTNGKNYTLEEDWVDHPLRLAVQERVYALFYLRPDAGQTPGEQGSCWVETSAGTRSFPVQIIKH